MTGPQREVPADQVLLFTADDLDLVAEALAELSRAEGDYRDPEDAVRVRRAADVLEYRRQQLARWIRNQEADKPAIRAARRV
jgi:hypothetical protein